MLALGWAVVVKRDLTGAEDVKGLEASSATVGVLLATGRLLGRDESEWPRSVNRGGGVGADWLAGRTCSRSSGIDGAEVVVVFLSVMTIFAC